VTDLVLSNWADDELVIKAQENDDAAFEELMRRTSASSFRLAVSILRDRQEAEDEVQNSYLKAWRHVGQFQRESKFSTWISRIVVNQCLMRLRKVRGTNFVYLDDPGSDERVRQQEVTDRSATPEVDLCNREMSNVLRREIGRLPPLLRNVLVLRDVDELSTAEVADRLGMTVSAVKSRLLRARIELRHRMEKHDGGAGRAALTA
jgi:RNA polymerase sigma-70 factor, ECF subfamily